MEIIVPFSIRKRELAGVVSDEAKKVFAKLKEKPELAKEISAKGLPERTTLHKVYATTSGGARRLLFLCRHRLGGQTGSHQALDRWILLFYRNKGDPVGENMSSKNPSFVSDLERNMTRALSDFAASSPEMPRYEKF